MRAKKVDRAQAEDFIRKLAFLKNEAFAVGLYQTGQTMDIATTKAGWELAGLIKDGSVADLEEGWKR